MPGSIRADQLARARRRPPPEPEPEPEVSKPQINLSEISIRGLRKLADSRGLDTTGSKEDLIARLTEE